MKSSEDRFNIPDRYKGSAVLGLLGTLSLTTAATIELFNPNVSFQTLSTMGTMEVGGALLGGLFIKAMDR